MMPLILGSTSPRRFELLTEIGVPFTVIPAEVEEYEGDALTPKEMVLHNARLKGEAVGKRFPERVILTADTTVFIENRILNKPRDLDDAWQMLRMLSGKTHSVFTGVFVSGPEEPFRYEIAVESRVTFKELEDAAIAAYFREVNPLDKAGGYGIQQKSELIVDRFEGSLSNVIGLPVEETREALQKFGFLSG